jgi:hypothetical protein
MATPPPNNTKFSQEDLNNAQLFNEIFKDSNKEVNELFSGLHSISDEIKGQVHGYQLANKTVNSLTGIMGKIKDIQDNITTANSKDLKTLQEKAQSERKHLETSQKLLQDKAISEGLSDKEAATLANINGLLDEEDGLYKSINSQLGEIVNSSESVEKTMGNLGALAEGFSKGLQKAGLGALDTRLGISKALQDTKDMVAAGKGNVNNLQASQHFVKQLTNNLFKSLDATTLLSIGIKELYAALSKADKETGELAKAFGTSYSEAASLRNELNTIANLSGDVHITTSALQKSLIAVNKEFGTATTFSGELLKDFTHLTEVAGYTNEAAARLSKISVATGTDLSDNTSKILGQAKAFNATNKLALNEKEIVEEVAKASKATTLSLGMQPGKLAQAVLQAKALGSSLSQVEKISESLLNFESSISSELEAELLTGKDMNLERARMYALNNDIAGVAREIAGQIGSAADFTKMNVIQQEALAKSVGMNREDLAASLIEREALVKIGAKDAEEAKKKFDSLVKQYGYEKAIKELGDEKYGKQLASQSIQERFNATIEKLREIFVSIAEPILQIVSPFMDLAATVLPLINLLLMPITGAVKFLGESVSFVAEGFKSIVGIVSPFFENIFKPLVTWWTTLRKENEATFKVLGAIGDALKGFLGTFILIIGAMKIFKALSKATLLIDAGKMIFAGIKAAFSLPGPLGLIAGTAATVGMTALGMGLYNRFKGDDVISPGYGKRTLLAGKDAISLNNNDTVIAGTSLGGKKSSSTVSSDMSRVEALLSQLIQKQSQPINVSVQVDGKEIAKAIGNRSTELGNSMVTNTYKVQ